MMVGPSGSGKSTAWKVLMKALARIEGVEGVAHVIDPKVRFNSFCSSLHSLFLYVITYYHEFPQNIIFFVLN